MDAEAWLDQCRAWCKQIKYIGKTLEWGEKPSRSDYLYASSIILDSSRTTIPELLFKGEFSSRRFGDVASYGLMANDGAELRRVFMLEVYPPHMRSHRDKVTGKAVYGPHLHLGDYRVAEVTREIYTRLVDAGMERWIRRFAAHAGIHQEAGRLLTTPISDDLFR